MKCMGTICPYLQLDCKITAFFIILLTLSGV